jgi:hypothetical protein
VPSVCGRNLQCQPVRGGYAREECRWSHACKSVKRSEAKAWEPMASSNANFCRKTQTPCPPDWLLRGAGC